LESTELATVVTMHTTHATLSHKINYANRRQGYCSVEVEGEQNFSVVSSVFEIPKVSCICENINVNSKRKLHILIM
jgi:hypothetical protein